MHARAPFALYPSQPTPAHTPPSGPWPPVLPSHHLPGYGFLPLKKGARDSSSASSRSWGSDDDHVSAPPRPQHRSSLGSAGHGQGLSRKNRPQRCSICKGTGHKSRTCKFAGKGESAAALPSLASRPCHFPYPYIHTHACRTLLTTASPPLRALAHRAASRPKSPEEPPEGDDDEFDVMSGF